MATFIIAEAGVNHNGNILMAHELIDAAAEAGANAVKFQTFSAKDLTTACAPKATYQQNNDGVGTQQSMLERLELTPKHHIELAEHCNTRGISFLSTAFGIPQLNLLLAIGIGAIKVPSGEITHLPLLEAMAEAAKTRKIPVYMSTGMCNLGEVEAALKIFLKTGIDRQEVTLMHCLSSYPAPYEEVNLRAIQTLAASFRCPTGYSDHTMGFTAPIAAVTLGATVVEKHMTLDRSLPGPDHQASLEPEEFRTMVDTIRETEQLLGDGIKQIQRSETNTRSVARRSIRASRAIPAGALLQPDDLICKRPAEGLSPMLLPQVIGRLTTKSYEQGECIDGPTNP